MTRVLALCIAVGGFVAGCASAPKTASQRMTLNEEAENTLQQMTTRDPALRSLVDKAAGYAIFPEVGQGGFIVGGASGKGVVYEQGKPTGYATLSQASVGAQIGGQKYSELILFRDQWALNQMKAGKLDLGAKASAVLLNEGAATAARFDHGVAVFVKPIGGAMLDVSLAGQTIKYSM